MHMHAQVVSLFRKFPLALLTIERYENEWIVSFDSDPISPPNSDRRWHDSNPSLALAMSHIVKGAGDPKTTVDEPSAE